MRLFGAFLVALLAQSPATLFRVPVNARQTLLIVQKDNHLEFFLIDNANPKVRENFAAYQNDPGTQVKVERASRNSVILSLTRDSGTRPSYLKVFFDAGAKKLLGKVTFNPVRVEHLISWKGAVYAVTGEVQVVARLSKERAAIMEGQEGWKVLEKTVSINQAREEGRSPLDPKKIFPTGIPQTTQAGLMRARGDEVRAHRLGTTIIEEAGPIQVVGDRIWFGKTFYNGEGVAGVGGIGYYSKTTKKFRIFSPRELLRWSVSALLVEGDTVWAGMFRQGEGSAYSGGLLRYDLATQQATVFPSVEFVTSILRGSDTLYLGSLNGVYALREGKLLHYVFEPGLDGKYVLTHCARPRPH